MKKTHFSKILLVVYLLSNLVNTKSYGQSTSSYEFGSGLHFESSDLNYQFDLGGLLLPYISYESINDETVNMFYGSKRTFFHFKANSEKENVSAYFLTDFSSSNLNKFSNKTFIDLGNFEIPVNPFFSASLRLNIL